MVGVHGEIRFRRRRRKRHRTTTDEPKFRAIVRHELAHLRNRDVDKAYLTIAIWWAFVVVAVVPMLLLVGQPFLLYGPSAWHVWGVPGSWAATGYVLGSLMVLTALVYLTRNAILRVRETHAHAVSARCDPEVMSAACAPSAAKDSRGWSLRSAPGQVRTVSAMTPIHRLGVRDGSKPGVCSRITRHHASGTGGLRQPAGSQLSDVWVGTTRVPWGPAISRSACTTAWLPPATKPMLLIDEWTNTTSPDLRSSARRSERRVWTVWGTS
jgi:hypothetical protein